MGAQKRGSEGGVGGFLHFFDWNAKSRKKLFSSKSESPEQPKQTKRTDGNMPITRFNTMDEDDMIGRSSLKGGSDYSCATSVTDEDGYGTKAPGVVARLMGLDSLPTYNFSDTYSNPSFDSRSFRDLSSNYIRKNHEFESVDCHMEQVFRPTKVKPQKISRAVEKFQSEMLPPKSAKSIPITSHKLLSPIKNSRFVSSSNPAQIMEAASKIPLVGSSSPSPSPSSSSLPLRVKVSMEKVENSGRKFKIPEASRRLLDSNVNRNLKSQQSLEPKKSISLALQAKANVQKREGLNHRGQSVKTHTNSERNSHKNPVSSNVLKQNNQKQNSLVDRGKSTPKMKKPVSQKGLTKFMSENSKKSHKKEPYSAPRRKRSMEESDQNNSWKNAVRDRSYRSNKNDVISFTFTSPISRPVISTNGFLSNNNNVSSSSSSSLSYNVIGGDALSTLLERKLRELTCHPSSASQDSFPTTETDIREDSSYGFSSFDPHKYDQDQDRISRDDSSVGFSRYDPLELMKKQHELDPNRDRNTRDDSSYGFSSNHPLESMMKQRTIDLDQDQMTSDDVSYEFSSNYNQERTSRDYEYRKFLAGREPSPNSTLEPSFITESCNSSDTANSCKQNSTSVQAMELKASTFSRNPRPMDIDTELLDSASSITTVSKFEPDYIKEVLSDIQTMFIDFTTGKTRKIVNPRVFDRLEFGRPDQEVVKLRRELVFNCVSECIETRCRVWAKGLAAMRKPELLAEDVYREIAGWEEMKDSMVDELVDKDMSGYSYKKWLDFDVEAFELGVEIESRLLDSLINELFDDILVL